MVVVVDDTFFRRKKNEKHFLVRWPMIVFWFLSIFGWFVAGLLCIQVPTEKVRHF